MKWNSIFDGVDLSPNYVHCEPIISANAEAEFTGQLVVNPDVLKKLIGDTSRPPSKAFIGDTLSFTFEGLPKMEQIRRHKKKRVNKKWAKRYGYRTVFKHVNIRDVTIVDSYDGTIDVIGQLENTIISNSFVEKDLLQKSGGIWR